MNLKHRFTALNQSSYQKASIAISSGLIFARAQLLSLNGLGQLNGFKDTILLGLQIYRN